MLLLAAIVIMLEFQLCALFHVRFPARHYSQKILRAVSSEPSSEIEGNKVKLPIVQLIDEKQELIGEFICGNDVNASVDKLKATLASLASSTSPSNEICETYVSNVYSDDQLTDQMLRGEKLLIIKVYREGCKKCISMEPSWQKLVDTVKSPRFKWLQAEVSNIPEYTAALKVRLKGTNPAAPS